MKIGIIVVLTLFASTFAAYFLLSDAGRVDIEYRGYVIEMSLHTLALLMIALFALIWLISKIIIAPRRIGEAAGRYRAARSSQKMTRGMIEVAEGNFTRGERMLATAASTSDSPLFNYLQAARAAHLQGRNERRDDWLKLAYQEVPEAANAVLLTQAEFQLDQGQHEQALATLRRLDDNSKNHGHALALMGRLYFQLEDWSSLQEILPRIKKYAQIKSETMIKWTSRIHREKLQDASDGKTILAIWKKIPQSHKSDMSLLEAYYQGLIRIGLHEKAEKELVTALKKNWRSPLVLLFGQVQGADATKQLTKAEGWLENHAEDPDLLLTVARLCLKNELWGKARSYLEALINLKPSAEGYQVYGDLLNQVGEADAASKAYEDGLRMITKNTL